MATPEKLPDFDDLIALTQSRTLAVDLTGLLGSATLSGTPTVTLTIVSGTDDSPATRVSAIALAAGSGGADKAISFRLSGLQPGIYRLVYGCPTSNSDNVAAFNYIHSIGLG